jgi:hypothetical protein
MVMPTTAKGVLVILKSTETSCEFPSSLGSGIVALAYVLQIVQ